MEEAIDILTKHKEIDLSPIVRKKLLNISASIEGISRHCSQHAAGVVITPKPIIEMVPVRKFGDSQIVTQYSMDPIEKLGLVKMDFLGLRTLTVISDAERMIRVHTPSFSMDKVSFDDPAVYDLLTTGETDTVILNKNQ